MNEFARETMNWAGLPEEIQGWINVVAVVAGYLGVISTALATGSVLTWKIGKFVKYLAQKTYRVIVPIPAPPAPEEPLDPVFVRLLDHLSDTCATTKEEMISGAKTLILECGNIKIEKSVDTPTIYHVWTGKDLKYDCYLDLSDKEKATLKDHVNITLNYVRQRDLNNRRSAILPVQEKECVGKVVRHDCRM